MKAVVSSPGIPCVAKYGPDIPPLEGSLRADEKPEAPGRLGGLGCARSRVAFPSGPALKWGARRCRSLH